MAQSLSQLYVHIVFHVKVNSVPIRLSDTPRIYTYIGGIIKQNNCSPIQINGMPDHVHILCTLSRTMTVSKLVQEIKSGSSRWIKEIDFYYIPFSWQGGYGAFSVSTSQCEKTARYIRNQAEHHKSVSYQDEYRMLLKAHGVDYDERYLWGD